MKTNIDNLRTVSIVVGTCTSDGKMVKAQKEKLQCCTTGLKLQ